MLQDMFDTELYMDSYRYTGESENRSTRYRDVENLKPQSESLLDENAIKLATRQSFYICPLPNATDWFEISFVILVLGITLLFF